MALILPSGPPNEKNLEDGIAVLRGWGLDPVLFRSGSSHPSGYLSEPDAIRAEQVDPPTRHMRNGVASLQSSTQN